MMENRCGKCRACCTVLGINELGKEVYCPCPYLNENGCAIYEERPASCRAYACVWRLGIFELSKEELSLRFEKEGTSWWESFAPSDSQHRPDELGVMFTVSDLEKDLCAYEVRENADIEKASEALSVINEKLPSSVLSEVKLHRFRKPLTS